MVVVPTMDFSCFSPTLLLLYKGASSFKVKYARKAKPSKERKRRKGLREKSIER
jgi:hypothetical protein